MTEEKKLTGFPSIDKPWLKYYTDEAINAPLPECTVYEYMYENNKDYPDDIALLYYNRKITYGELFENIDKTARAFTAIGVKNGDIVTVATPSMPEALYCVYALNRLGAVANMIHPLASENEICHYLNEVKSTVFVMFTGTYELIKDSLSKTCVKTAIVASPAESLSVPVRLLYKLKSKEPKFSTGSIFQSWRSFIKAGKSINVNYQTHDPNEMAVISHTGGTTGEPKGVMCSDNNLNALIIQLKCNFKYQRQGKSLVSLPPFVNYSLVEAMMMALAIGYQVVLIPKFESDKFSEYLERYRPNLILSIPAYWKTLLELKKDDNTDLSSLEQIYYGGESMDEETERRINAVLKEHGSTVELCKGLGSTELVAGATLSYSDCNPIGSVGIPLVFINCKILDPETGTELPYCQEGEIALSGPTLMLGYYDKTEATNEVVKMHDDGNRWLHTGDLGHITEDGIIYVTGRIKRIIMTKGDDGQVTKMFPDRIEKAILEHPAVGLCCVVGIEDDKRIHYPKAFVVLNNGYEKSDTTTAEILAVCKENLPAYMVPEMIEYRDDLPRTSRGKVDYRALEQETKG